MSTPIILTTLNARFHHSAFGLRYLFANLGEFQANAKIFEFTINQNPREIAEKILLEDPKVVGFGIYIWNTNESFQVISILKRLRKDLVIVLGGPEVSYEMDSQDICRVADFVIRGEAERLFYEFCHTLFSKGELPAQKWISGALPELKELVSPYDLYTDEDVAHRTIYVEASRGCPYKCEYCLSSLDKSVRSFDLDRFLFDMKRLLNRGARKFKFVDRTFNLSITTSSRILRFFLDHTTLGIFLHFEMVPDRLPEELKALIKEFPAGSLQFEVGIQTWDPSVARLISRRQDYQKIISNFQFLTEETGVHIHADLIVGLPGETLESFAEGFDALSSLGPQEIQIGILKRLKGTPIVRHDQAWEMIYQEHPPFQILSTKNMRFETIQELCRFAQFWDICANSGNFPKTLELLKSMANRNETSSFFREFRKLSLFLTRRHPQGNGIALINLLESLWIYLIEEVAEDRNLVRSILISDYCGRIKRDIPRFLTFDSQAKSEGDTENLSKGQRSHIPRRQFRHKEALEISGF